MSRARPGLALRAAEAGAYALVLAAAGFVLASAVGVALALVAGDVRITWLVVESLLFFGGLAVLGIAAFRLRPKAPHKLAREDRERRARNDPSAGEEGGSDPFDEGADGPDAAAAAARPETGTVRTDLTRFEALVDRLPPFRDRSLLPDDRFAPGAKQLLAGALLVVLSAVVHELFVG